MKEEYTQARVTSEYKGAYKVKTTDGEYSAKITGKQMLSAETREDYPAVGDWVTISIVDQEKAIIRSISPRKTILKRKDIGGKFEEQIIAVNIDAAFIVESVDRDFNLNRFERYFVLLNEGGIRPIIILNKTDLISGEDLDVKLGQLRERFQNVEILLTSTATGQGVADVIKRIESGKTYCFLGSSGVGKSSLINAILGIDDIKTREIGFQTGRGKHTTTSREMYFLENGGVVIDNPGIREVGMTNNSGAIENVFVDISSLAKNCKFPDCSHIHEPGCAVLEALKAGQIDREQYQNFLKLRKESEFFEASAHERREKDKKFGKYVKQIKEQMKR